ncbi:MAG: hypothetical protein RR728_05430 [Oscillospiraceae bacterium]
MKKKLLPLAYIAYITVFSLLGCANFAIDKISVKEEIVLPIQEIKKENLKQLDDNLFIAVTNDPQLIISIDPEQTKLRTIGYTLKQGGTGEKSMYYQRGSQTEFSEKRCVIPRDNSGKTVRYALGVKGVTKIRLDICGTAGEMIEIDSVTLNLEPKISDYFFITPMKIAKFLVLPLIFSAVLLYILELYEFYIKKQR